MATNTSVRRLVLRHVGEGTEVEAGHAHDRLAGVDRVLRLDPRSAAEPTPEAMATAIPSFT